MNRWTILLIAVVSLLTACGERSPTEADVRRVCEIAAPHKRGMGLLKGESTGYQANSDGTFRVSGVIKADNVIVNGWSCLVQGSTPSTLVVFIQ